MLIKLVSGLLGFVSGLIKLLGDRQLIEAGEAKMAAAALKKARTHVRQGRAAMDRIDSDPDYRARVRERFTRDK